MAGNEFPGFSRLVNSSFYGRISEGNRHGSVAEIIRTIETGYPIRVGNEVNYDSDEIVPISPGSYGMSRCTPFIRDFV